jgi:hypothetical protein
MGFAIVLVVVFGFVFPCLLWDLGSRPADRIADGYGVPRQWFDTDTVNRYARFGRSIRLLGLGIGGILGWGIARGVPVADGASLYRCEPSLGAPSLIIRAPFAPPGIAPALQMGANPQITSVPQSFPVAGTVPLMSADRLKSQVSSQTFATRKNDALPRWGAAGTLIARSTVACGANSHPKFGSGISKATRLDTRGFVGGIAGALLGLGVATFLAERRNPELTAPVNDPVDDLSRKSSRTSGSLLGPALLIMLIAPARSGTISSPLLYPSVFVLAGLLLGIRTVRNVTKSRRIDRPYVALYPRALRDYVPDKLALGWIGCLSTFCLAIVSNGTHLHVNDPTQWFSSPEEYWSAAGLLFVSALCALLAMMGVVRSGGALEAEDPRALIIDDARRAAAIQRVAGASMFLLMLVAARFAPREQLGRLGGPAFVFCFWGAVVWCSPAGIPPRTAERWKSLFSTSSGTYLTQGDGSAKEADDPHRGIMSGAAR